MKKLFPAVLLLLLLTACSSGPEVSDTPSDMAVNTRTDVTMEVVEGTAMPGAVTVTILNTGDAEIDSGNEHDFAIQVEKDGLWYPLEEPKDLANTAEALIFSCNEPREMVLTWGRRYGSLPKGHYRAVKGFFEFNPEGPPHEHFVLAAEFILA